MKTKFFKFRVAKKRLTVATKNVLYCGSVEDLTLEHDTVNQNNVVIKNGENEHLLKFQDPTEAKNFVDEISVSLIRNATMTQVGQLLRKALIGVIAVSALMLLLNLNASLFNITNHIAVGNTAANAGFDPGIEPPLLNTGFDPGSEPPLLSTSSPTSRPPENSAVPPVQPPVQQHSQQTAAPEIIARTLKQGVKTGDYSVDLGKGNGPDLYVFSDVSCPHCKDAETVFEGLAKEGINVHIFPVSVISEAFYKASDTDKYQGALRRIVSVLCHRGEERSSKWVETMNTTPSLTPKSDEPLTSCEAGGLALSVNDKMFRALNLPGTPALINSTGHQFPADQTLTVAAVKAWASE